MIFVMQNKQRLKLDDLGSNLFLTEHGIWKSRQKADVSYPADGNDVCFEIEDQSFWFRHRNNCIISVIHAYPYDDTQPIFDVGGGNGYVTKGLQDTNMHSVLIEPGERGAANAFSRGVRNVICSTLQDANFREKSIAAVGLFDVIEHVENDVKFINEVHELMADGAKIYITVPAYQWLWSIEDINAGHFRRYTKNSLQTLLINSGFDVLYASYIFAFLTLPIFLFRAFPFKLNLVRPKSSKIAAKVHNKSNGALGGMIDKFMEKELQRIKKCKSIIFGSSIILVAQKHSKLKTGKDNNERE